ncbi:MAG: tetratricopeptide repeat protein [Bacteroidales bacterium]|nr:tetratricopeptide repeat protein [Bacteroidales bacterium]
MKKILFSVVFLAATLVAGAQNYDALRSKIKSAEAAAQDPKKAVKPATWISLADAYIKAYDAPKGNVMTGLPIEQVKMLALSGKQCSGIESVDVSGAPYTKHVYPDFDLYVNAGGVLEFMVVTNPVCNEDVLAKAVNALVKANEVDPKGSKLKDIQTKLNTIREDYVNDGMSQYSLGNVRKAAELFEASLAATDNKAANVVDSMMIYYSAVAYSMVGDQDKAMKYFLKCDQIGYDSKGDVQATIADIYKKEGKVAEAKSILEKTFTKYPTSQALLIGLINIYTETNEDPDKVLSLIHDAQANEPKNASLYYAEGNILKNLGRKDEAIKLFLKSQEVDPNYSFGPYAVGDMYFQEAIAIQEAINNLDIRDTKGYEKLLGEFETALKNSIDPFEKAFSISDDPALKEVCANALKQVFFRFRTESAEYQAGYDKYNNWLAENGKQ